MLLYAVQLIIIDTWFHLLQKVDNKLLKNPHLYYALTLLHIKMHYTLTSLLLSIETWYNKITVVVRWPCFWKTLHAMDLSKSS